jgi:hypothetical protein
MRNNPYLIREISRAVTEYIHFNVEIRGPLFPLFLGKSPLIRECSGYTRATLDYAIIQNR